MGHADAAALVRATFETLGRAVRAWVRVLRPLQQCRLLLLVPQARSSSFIFEGWGGGGEGEPPNPNTKPKPYSSLKKKAGAQPHPAAAVAGPAPPAETKNMK